MMALMGNKKTLKDEIVEAMVGRLDSFGKKLDGRFRLFEEKMDGRFGSFEQKLDNRFEDFEKKMVAEFDEKTRYQGILMERIEGKVDSFGEELEMIETKIDRHYEEFQEFRGEVNFKLDVQHKSLDSRIAKLEEV